MAINMIAGKKAMLESTLGKVVFGLILIIILIGLVLIFSGVLDQVWDGFTGIFRFGS